MSQVSQHSDSPRERFESWVQEHGSAVRGYLRGMVGSADLADDLLQETFRRAWQSHDRYQETGFARAYLIRIADRLVVDHRRKSGRETTYDESYWHHHQDTDHPAASPTAALEREEAKQQLAAALKTLSPPQRRVLLLRFYGELEFKQIAELLGCPLGTALSHCRRGLLSLRKQMEDEAL